MRSNDWRTSLHTFVDDTSQIYTVTNVPPLINIAPNKDTEFLANLNLGSLLRPRLSTESLPELPFVLRRDPVGDPLLSRLCLDPTAIIPTEFERGWALSDDIRNAWIRLEDGLLHISELLLTSTERSSCGTSARHAIRDHAHYPPPEDYGYRQAHQSVRVAQKSIIRAHLAFRLLVARCSLAVSLWLFPGAEGGHIPQVVTTHYDIEMDSSVPDWVSILRRERVPHSWIDAVRDSVITDFSINLRVGTVIDPIRCEWLAMLPVLRAANIPVFVRWQSPSEIAQVRATSPFMESFAPSSPKEVHLALQHGPTGKPRIFTLCRGEETRPLPDYSAFDDNTPPFGPYQQPGESRTEFLKRRECYSADRARQETQSQIEGRQKRMDHAHSSLPPLRRSRVYLWVYAELVYPDLSPQWFGKEYRYPIPPSAYRSLWMVHSKNCRVYNPYYDEWDLWFPSAWGLFRDDDTDPKLDMIASGLEQRVPDGLKYASRHMVATAVHEEEELLIPTPENRVVGDIYFPPDCRLHSWYGLWVADTRIYADVNYNKWEKRLMHHFSEMTDQFPTDAAIQKCISGWMWAILEGRLESPALRHTWDLDQHHPKYLLREGATSPRHLISMDHYQAPQRQAEQDGIGRWVLVTFQKDPKTQMWSLFTSAMGALFLLRRIHKVQTSSDALFTLTASGIPSRTGILLGPPPSPVLHMPIPSVRQLHLPYRQRGERPSLKDYDAYCQRVLELSRRPHLRAAWLKGGIVWRIMAEITGGSPWTNNWETATFRDELVQGPSGAIDHYQPVTTVRNGSSFYDDDLSLAELEIISGVVRVHTGIGAQTEDVSWWPKHHAWVKGSSYTGTWTSLDEHWFRTRLKQIYDGEAQPLNSHEWREALRKRKMAGRLAMAAEEQSWIFTYQHFVLPQSYV